MTWSTLRSHRVWAYLREPRLGALSAALLFLVLSLPVWLWAGRWDEARLLADERGQLAASLSPLGYALTTAVNRRLARLDDLKAFVEAELSSSKSIQESRLDTFVTGLFAGDGGIRNFAVAPAGIVSYVYPLAGNQNVLGHDLLQDERPFVRADIRRTIRTGRIALSGPYELRQGGLGLVARYAISRNGSFWGLVTMVLDVPSLLKDAGMDTHPPGLALALRDSSGKIFHGPPAVFESRPVSQHVFLPEGWWDLAGVPVSGWHGAISQSLFVFRSVGLAVVLLLVGLLYQTINRTSRLRVAVRERTEELERDIAKRKLIEEELRVSHTYFSSIVGISEDAIISIDAAQQITLFNQGAEKIFGYSASDVLGKSLNILIPKRFLESHARHVESFGSSPDILRPMNDRGVIFGRRKDGTEFPAEASISKFEVKGENVLTVRLRDITERKHMEAQIRQTQKMEAIGTLAGGIAHDFNNLLAAILGHAELVMDNMPKDGTAWQDLQQVLSAGHRAKDLVRQILTFSRQTEQERKPVSVHLIVAEALKLLRSSLPATIEIRHQIDSDAGSVLADDSQIHQVLMNLCTNAEHAMRERGGVLDVNLRAVMVDRDFAASHPPLRLGPHVRLTVRDTGQGIPPRVRERMFEPFFTTKGPGEGTGMGLAVVHGIVAAHRGAILVDTAPGRGTKFDIYFPTCDPAAATEAPAEEPLHGGRERILIVDDEPFLAHLWGEMLQRLGYRVTGFTNSLEALENFRAAPETFDLLITDQTMPNMTGEALASECLRIRPEMPIILCTGFSHTMTEDKARTLGIRAYLMKPLARRELTVAVRCVLDQRPSLEAQTIPGLTIITDPNF